MVKVGSVGAIPLVPQEGLKRGRQMLYRYRLLECVDDGFINTGGIPALLPFPWGRPWAYFLDLVG